MAKSQPDELAAYVDQAKRDAIFAYGFLRETGTLTASHIGFNITQDPVHVHDLQATILHLLGMDHTKLTYHHQGRDYRLTDVHGELVTKILA